MHHVEMCKRRRTEEPSALPRSPVVHLPVRWWIAWGRGGSSCRCGQRLKQPLVGGENKKTHVSTCRRITESWMTDRNQFRCSACSSACIDWSGAFTLTAGLTAGGSVFLGTSMQSGCDAGSSNTWTHWKRDKSWCQDARRQTAAGCNSCSSPLPRLTPQVPLSSPPPPLLHRLPLIPHGPPHPLAVGPRGRRPCAQTSDLLTFASRGRCDVADWSRQMGKI